MLSDMISECECVVELFGNRKILILETESEYILGFSQIWLLKKIYSACKFV